MPGNLVRNTEDYGLRARRDRSIQSGRVVSVNATTNTAILDVGMVDNNGNPVYMTDVPFTPQSPPSFNDVVSIERTSSSAYSMFIGGGGQIGGGNSGQVVSVDDGWIFKEAPSGSKNSSNKVFTLTYVPVTGSDHVFLNGLLQQAGGDDYTISSETITFVVAPDATDKLVVTYKKNGRLTVAQTTGGGGGGGGGGCTDDTTGGWFMFGGTAALASFRDAATDVGTECWSYGSAGFGSPAVQTDNGSLVILDNNLNMVTINPDGTQRAILDLSSFNLNPQPLTTVGNTIIIVRDNPSNGGVDAYDLDLNLLWNYDPSPDSVLALSASVGDDGFIYCAISNNSTGNGWIVALNASNGTVHHSWDSDPGAIWDGPQTVYQFNWFLYSSGSVYLVMNGSNQAVIKHNAATGAVTWTSDGSSWTGGFSGNEIYAPSISGGNLYFLTAGDSSNPPGYCVVCLDAATGSFVWKYYKTHMAQQEFSEGLSVGAGVVVVPINGTSSNDCCVCLDAATGAENWIYTHTDTSERIGNAHAMAPVIGNDGYVLIARSSLLRIAISDGTLQSKTFDSLFPLTPTLGDSLVYVPEETTALHALS